MAAPPAEREELPTIATANNAMAMTCDSGLRRSRWRATGNALANACVATIQERSMMPSVIDTPAAARPTAPTLVTFGRFDLVTSARFAEL